MTEERFLFTSGAKRQLTILGAVGLVLLIIGILGSVFGGGHEEGEQGHEAKISQTSSLTASLSPMQEEAKIQADQEQTESVEGEHHGSAVWVKRLYSNLWINNMYFMGLGIIGLFFIAIQYASQAGWSAGMLRVALAMAHWIPISGVLLFVSWFIVKGDVFHWTHTDLYSGEHADEVLIRKSAYWYWPLKGGTFPIFYIVRMIVFFVLWYLFFIWIKGEMLAQDIDAKVSHWYKARSYSAIFLVIFAVTSSIAAWDWLMSIDPHWFSTMYGWYLFATWWVNGLAAITLVVVILKQNGYLQIVNANHLHDIGKFIFAFTIFWAYIWFSQFLLIYYANLPEETVHYVERLQSSQYNWVFYVNLIMNFFLPFLLLMTRDSKRHMSLLKLICPIVLVGHWMDFYLLVTPGVMKEDGGFGFMEIGMALIFLAVFLFVTLTNLAKVPLFGKNHPMLQESLHHNI